LSTIIIPTPHFAFSMRNKTDHLKSGDVAARRWALGEGC
jgi:hypothetical protein